MRKPLLAISTLGLVFALSGCASSNGGYASAGYPLSDCELGGECYGGYDGSYYACNFYEAPSAAARLDLISIAHRHRPRFVHDRGDSTPGGSPDWSSSSSSASSSSTSVAASPPPVAREPVVMASPQVERSPRSHD